MERLVAMTEEDLNPTSSESLATPAKLCRSNDTQNDECRISKDPAPSVAPPAPPVSRPRTTSSVHSDVESATEIDVPADPQSK